MARFGALRPGFIWSLGTAVTQAEIQRFDEAQNKALSETGGTWNLTTDDIIIAGSSFGLYAHRLSGGNVGSGVPALTALGTAIDTHASSALTVGGTMTAPAGATLTGGNGVYPTRSGTSSQTARVLRNAFVPSSSNWAPSATNPGQYVNFALSSAVLWVELFYSPNAQYQRGQFKWAPASGHAGLPSVKPTKQMFSLDASDNLVAISAATTLLGNAGGATVPLYELGNTEDNILPGTARPNPNLRYFLRITPESGANALSGLTIGQFNCDILVDRLGWGGEPSLPIDEPRGSCRGYTFGELLCRLYRLVVARVRRDVGVGRR
jgi:hypothetical protein